MVTNDQVERAMNYLATTDMEIADWRVAVLRSEYLAEVAEALAFRHCEGSVEARKQEAKTTEEVKKAKESYFDAVRHFEIVKARRKRAELTIEMWRTAESSRRAGQMQ